MTELEKALACSEWFCALIRRRLTFVSMDPTPSIDWLFMVEQSRLAHRLSGDSELLDDYRFWRERDPELKSLAVE